MKEEAEEIDYGNFKNAASMATVAPLIGKRAAFVCGFVIAFGAVLCGVVVNLLPFEVISPALTCGCSAKTPSLVGHVSAVLLALLAGFHILRQWHRKI